MSPAPGIAPETKGETPNDERKELKEKPDPPVKKSDKKSRPYILYGEDNSAVRRSVSDLLQNDDFKCQVQSPSIFRNFNSCLITKFPDGLLMDNDLTKWGANPRNGEEETGYNVVKFYKKLNPIIPIGLYSRNVEEIPEDPSIILIDKFHSQKDYKLIKKEFNRFVGPANKARKLFGEIQPKKKGESYIFELNKYRIFLEIFKQWMNFGFQELGNPFWFAICDREIKMIGSAGGEQSLDLNDIKIVEATHYPSESELQALGSDSIYKTLIYWNAQSKEIIDEQFKNAGDALEKIPVELREYFGICMTPSCVELYLAGEKDKALRRIKLLNPSSQLEFVKAVFKSIKDVSKREKFNLECEKNALPAIISIFFGRLSRIEEHFTIKDGKKETSDKKTGWVELKDFHSPKRRVAEPFDYKLLSRRGVGQKNDEFEYAIYHPMPNSVAFDIVPDIDFWKDFKKSFE